MCIGGVNAKVNTVVEYMYCRNQDTRSERTRSQTVQSNAVGVVDENKALLHFSIYSMSKFGAVCVATRSTWVRCDPRHSRLLVRTVLEVLLCGAMVLVRLFLRCCYVELQKTVLCRFLQRLIYWPPEVIIIKKTVTASPCLQS
jgi:hypothetical protein